MICVLSAIIVLENGTFVVFFSVSGSSCTICSSNPCRQGLVELTSARASFVLSFAATPGSTEKHSPRLALLFPTDRVGDQDPRGNISGPDFHVLPSRVPADNT